MTSMRNKKRKIKTWDFIKNYKFQSIFFSYFFYFLLIILIMVILYGWLLMQSYRYSVEQESLAITYKMLNKTTEIFDMINFNIERDFYKLSTSYDVKEWIHYDKTTADSVGYNYLTRKIKNELFQIAASNKNIESVYIFNVSSKSVLTDNDEKPIDDFYDHLWYTKYKDENKKSPIYSRRKYAHNPSYDMISFIKEIYTRDNTLSAIVIFNIYFDEFDNAINQDYQNGSLKIDLLTSEGNIFYSSVTDRINKNINHYSSDAIFNNISERNIMNPSIIELNDNTISALNKSRQGSLYLLSSVPKTYAAVKNNTFFIFSIGGMIGFILSIILAFIVSLKMYKYIINMFVLLESPSHSGKNTSEITAITNNIVNMMEKNKQIEQELATKFAELKKSQAIALQTQINPHFLNNTLNFVNLNIIKTIQADNEATEIISLLCDILQSNLDTINYLVKFSTELENAEKYLKIQNIKYRNSFVITKNIDEKLLSCKTVTFILQPILENCISHGLVHSKKTEKHIAISVYAENLSLIISIADNGIGMTSDELENVLNMLSEDAIRETTHIGLSNVHKRIQIIYGKGYGLKLESTVNVGTTVTIRLPLEYME